MRPIKTDGGRPRSPAGVRKGPGPSLAFLENESLVNQHVGVKSRQSIIINDDRLLELFYRTTPLEKIAGGFEFLEGPVWHPYKNYLIFSDIIGDTMYRLTPAQVGAEIEVFRKPSRKANGNTYDKTGRLLTCEHASLSVVRASGEEEPAVLTGRYGGMELNSPNDIITASDGTIFFTDPNSGRTSRYGVEREKELAFQGVFRMDPESGRLTLLADDFELPNGLCLSPDETLLYVNDTKRMHIRIFELRGAPSSCSLENGRIWTEVRGSGHGKPDGMKCDSRGNVFCTGPGGIHIYDSAARLLGRILVPEFVANFAWGDRDLKSLYITASESLYRFRMKTAGPRLF